MIVLIDRVLTELQVSQEHQDQLDHLYVRTCIIF